MKGLMVPLLIVLMTGTVVGQQRVNDGTSSDEIASVLNRQSNNFSPLADRQSESANSILAPMGVTRKPTGPTPDDSFGDMTDPNSSTMVRQSATGEPEPDMFYVATERGDLLTLKEKAEVSLGVDIVPVDRSTGRQMQLSYATGVVLQLDVNNGKRLNYIPISPVRIYKNEDGDNVIRFELTDDEIDSLIDSRLQYAFTEGQRGQINRVEFASASAIMRAREDERNAQNPNSIVSRNGASNGFGDSRFSIPTTGIAAPGDFNFVGPVQPSSPFSRQRTNVDNFSNFQDQANRRAVDLPDRRETNSFSGGLAPPNRRVTPLPENENDNALGQSMRPITNADWQLAQERQRIAREKEELAKQKAEFQQKQEALAWQQQQERLRQPNVIPERYSNNTTQFGGGGQQQLPPNPTFDAPPLKRTQEDIDTLANNDLILNQKLDRLFDAVSGNNIRQVSMQTKIDPLAIPINGNGMQSPGSPQNGFDPSNQRSGGANSQGERMAALDQPTRQPGVVGGLANQGTETDKKINEVDRKKTVPVDRGAGQATFMLLLGSLGLNAYLGLLCRSIYVRYNEIGDELRETFTSGLSRD